MWSTHRMAGITTHASITDAPERERWSAFVAAHPKGSVFHTPEMHEVHARTRRYDPLTLAAVDAAGEVQALVCAVRVATLPSALGAVGSRSLQYAEPLCRPGAEGALAAVLREHDRRMRHRTLFAETRPLHAPGGEREVLELQGHRWEPYLNYLIDLSRPEEAVWGAFTGDARRKVRRSRDAGVTVEEDDGPDAVVALHVLLQDVYRRARVPLADISLFHAAREVLVPRRMARTFLARHEGEVVGAHCLLTFGGRAFGWYWANVRTRGLFVQEQLIWHSLRQAQEAGLTVFDMGGAGRPDEPYGVREFKRQFGGEEVSFGRYRRVWSPRRMALAERAYDVLRRAGASAPPASAAPGGRG